MFDQLMIEEAQVQALQGTMLSTYMGKHNAYRRFHYRLNQLQRDAMMRAANRRRLIHKALENRPKTRRAYAAALLTLWHSLFR